MLRTRHITNAGLLTVVTLLASPLALHAQSCVANANGLRCFGTDLSSNPGAQTIPTLTNSNAARDNFFGNLVGVGTETFEALTGSSPFVLNFPGAGTATLTGESEIISSVGAGRYPISGSRFLEAVSASGGGSTFTIAFGSTVGAFGFFGTDIGDFLSQLTLRFTLANGLGFVDWQLPYTASSGVGSTRDAAALYAGFIDTRGFTQVQFLGTDADDFFGFDNMTIGSLQQVTPPSTAVPEPGTFVLLSAGLVGAAVMHRRRRRA